MAMLPAHLYLSLKSAFMEEDITLGGDDALFYWVGDRCGLIRSEKWGSAKSQRLAQRGDSVTKVLTEA